MRKLASLGLVGSLGSLVVERSVDEDVSFTDRLDYNLNIVNSYPFDIDVEVVHTPGIVTPIESTEFAKKPEFSITSHELTMEYFEKKKPNGLGSIIATKNPDSIVIDEVIYSQIKKLDADVVRLQHIGIDVIIPKDLTVKEFIMLTEFTRNSGLYSTIELDTIVSLYPTITDDQIPPNDPLFGDLYAMQKLNMEAAWNTFTNSPNSGSSSRICVIDTGSDFNHPDLSANLWVNEIEANGLPGVDDDNNGFVDDIYGANALDANGNVLDGNSHGTHVAGTVGALANNFVGVTGVSWNPEIVTCKFLSDSGSGSISGALRCLDYCVGQDASISNNSWGGGSKSSSFETALINARNQGHIFVTSAGNSGIRLPEEGFAYPTMYDVSNVIAVGSTNKNDAKSGFSNYGPTWVELGAPGESILSATPDDKYAYKSGTSMAAPHVAGILSLMKSYNPVLTSADAIDCLKKSVVQDPTYANVFEWEGIPDADVALQLAGQAVWITPDGGWTQGTSTTKFTVPANGQSQIPLSLKGTMNATIFDGSLEFVAKDTNGVIVESDAIPVKLTSIGGTTTGLDLSDYTDGMYLQGVNMDTISYVMDLPNPSSSKIALTIEIISEVGGDILLAYDSLTVPPLTSYPLTVFCTPKDILAFGSMKLTQVIAGSSTIETTINMECFGGFDFPTEIKIIGEESLPSSATVTLEKRNKSTPVDAVVRSQIVWTDQQLGQWSTYEYSLIEPQTATNSYVSLSTIGAQEVVALTGQDDKSDYLILTKFRPKFFGESDEFQVGVSTNGVMSIGTTSFTQDWAPALFVPREPNNVVAPFWVDLASYGGSNSKVWFYEDEQNLMIEWQDWQYYGKIDSNVNFQVIMSRDGEVRFLYSILDGSGNVVEFGVESKLVAGATSSSGQTIGNMPLQEGNEFVLEYLVAGNKHIVLDTPSISQKEFSASSFTYEVTLNESSVTDYPPQELPVFILNLHVPGATRPLQLEVPVKVSFASDECIPMSLVKTIHQKIESPMLSSIRFPDSILMLTPRSSVVDVITMHVCRANCELEMWCLAVNYDHNTLECMLYDETRWEGNMLIEQPGSLIDYIEVLIDYIEVV
eukprot:GHVP01054916.1.p1 GENE.GHVP01054916.1~~GHVP01054916.1.p1  ORF type:complete len:1094 (+),score=162.56 GHVP01054916.1:822-4103(+)